MTAALSVLLVGVFVVSAVALILNSTAIFLATFVAGILVLLAQGAMEDRKTWTLWLVVGVFVASLVSGVFGVGAMAAFAIIPVNSFPAVLFGWVFGDVIVLASIGTVLSVALTPYIVKTRAYVHRFFS
jgi:hypothetical protein